MFESTSSENADTQYCEAFSETGVFELEMQSSLRIATLNMIVFLAPLEFTRILA